MFIVKEIYARRYIGDFTQSQQKYAGTEENCNIAIPFIFYPVIKTYVGV